MAVQTPICDFGASAPDFSLPGVDGKTWTRDECTGEKGLLVMFICNHCPYVKSVRERIIRDARELMAMGIGVVGINANDASKYPDDSFEAMQATAKQYDYPFPYLFDETQEVARAYDAVCTPDFFGYSVEGGLQYRGRLDESRKETAPEGATRELFEAMSQVAASGKGPEEQIPSMGCSIKWKQS